MAAVQELDKTLAEKIATTLFWQRPLREQSHLVGKCPLEPKRNRAQIGHPDFETFRALSFVNNIRVLDGEMRTPLTAEQRAVAADCFIRKSPFEFNDIAKKLRKQFKALADARFNYDDDNPSPSPSKVTADLNGILPDSTDAQKAFDALTFFDDDEKLKTWAQNEIGLSEEDSARFVNILIPEGRAGYSLHACVKVLNFPRRFFSPNFQMPFLILARKRTASSPRFTNTTNFTAKTSRRPIATHAQKTASVCFLLRNASVHGWQRITESETTRSAPSISAIPKPTPPTLPSSPAAPFSRPSISA